MLCRNRLSVANIRFTGLSPKRKATLPVAHISGSVCRGIQTDLSRAWRSRGCGREWKGEIKRQSSGRWMILTKRRTSLGLKYVDIQRPIYYAYFLDDPNVRTRTHNFVSLTNPELLISVSSIATVIAKTKKKKQKGFIHFHFTCSAVPVLLFLFWSVLMCLFMCGLVRNWSESSYLVLVCFFV